MALRNAKALTIRPSGVSDAIDGTNAFPGAMTSLANLVPSVTTAGLFVPRPAATVATSFGGFSTPAGVTCLLVVGSRVYGMISSALNSGKDQPFCYDILTGAFIAISGITAANTPATQPTTGDWVPPIMAAITATKIIVCHPGFDGITHFFGTIDISTFASPAWSSGNTATRALVAVPKSVAQFNGRAWYAVLNTLVFSDSLDPNTVTNATQILTLGDNQPVTAVCGLPLNNQFVGGVVQSLIAFKGAEGMWQITGDAATSNLVQNELNVQTGTLAPNTIVPTPIGLAFVAPDGVRIMDQSANISDPIAANGKGVNLPFTTAISPSRMCAAFNENVLRIAVQNGSISSQPQEEYWFDFSLKIWTGPHTLPSAQIASVYVGANTFVAAAIGVNAKLFVSRATPALTSAYTENGVALTNTFKTVLLPDNQQMSMNAIIQAALAMSLPATLAVTVQAVNEVGDILDTVYITAPVTSTTIWGAFTWGSAVWGAVTGYFQQYRVPWSKPLVFKQMTLSVTCASMNGYAVGNWYLQYQILGYMLQQA